MTTFTEKLNLVGTNGTYANRAVCIDIRRDTDIYETVCLYCADNDVDLKDVTDVDFETAVEAIENFKSNPELNTCFYFWFDKQ